ncbi:sentrin-specific protease 3-like [Solenopsis invicta]|uniref:sentrin-specific protease 3-like n=1 Tax=Solenopsis invicta TaxID=13686 RepID=UPI000E33FAF9|nr:sentrin-specific protease 3-like [Solenopsis invicta]
MKNHLFVPQFMTYLIDELLPYYPLWSAILIKEFDIRRHLNAAVENWHKIIKHYLFDGKMRQLIPRAINTLAKNVHNRLLQRKYGTRTTRQMKNSEFNIKAQSKETDIRGEKIVVKETSDNELDLDLQTENWCRNIKSMMPYSACFANFQKSLIPTKKKSSIEKYVVKCDDKIGKKHISPNTCGISNPWLETNIDIYPENWRLLSFYVSNILINEQSLMSLLPNTKIDDNIINSFLNISNSTSIEKEPLIFDPQFFVPLLDESKRFGFFRWAQKIKAWTYKIWLLPKCENDHWTLLLIVFPRSLIVYFDSLHGTPSKKLMRRLCGFIDKLFGNKGLPSFDWKNWTLYCPTDIPSQITSTGAGVNCGAHVCVWGYIICTSRILVFTEEDMLNIRKWIFDEIVGACGKNISTTVTVFEGNKVDPVKHESKDSDLIKLSRQAPASSTSTVEYCACLKHMV